MRDPALELRGLRKTYKDGDGLLTVLDGANLAVERGSTAAIVGRSGSGKSTLLNIAGLLDRPDSGEVFVGGQSASGLSERGRTALRAGRIGFVFQNYHMLADFTVVENVMLGASLAGLGRGRAVRLRALELLDRVGLTARADRIPARLSGGEQQRAAIARALMAGPDVLLCDEPTGNLDPQTGTDVCDWLWRAAAEADMAIVLVTHDMALARRARCVWRLENGMLAPDKN